MNHSFISLLAAALCICGLSSCDMLDSLNFGGNKNNEDDKTVTTDWSDPAWYSTNYWDRTDREKAGLRGPVKKWHIGNYTTYDEYEYDREGHLVKESHVDTQKPENNHHWQYSYDNSGRCIKKEYVGSEEEAGDYILYEYNNPGKFVAMEWFMMGPEISGAKDGIRKDLSHSLRVIEQPYSKDCREISYTFNSEGNLVIRESSYEIYDGSEEKANETTTEYTIVYENGYPKSLDSESLRYKILNITWYPNGMYEYFVYKEQNAYNFETGWDIHAYKMLDNPRYLEVETFDLEGTASYTSLTPKWMRKSYDEHFDIVKNEESYGEDAYTPGAEPTFTDTWTEYTYDKYGNWVTRVESFVARYSGQQGKSTITREIEYFD